MSNLISKGLIEVEGMKFHDIEGSFGESKKAMLVKDIAVIHNRELKHVNELINNNRKRFKNGIDIIDLLGVGLSDTEIKQFGFTQQAINSYRGLKAKGQTTGIYILSERGYSKLLKILEDDFAWEQYEKLVDGYFNMRKVIKEQPKESYTIQDPIERAKAWIKEQEEKQKLLEENEKNKPKVLFADAVSTSHTSILVGDLAKILKQNGVNTGANRLFEWLRREGYLIKRKGTDYNMPTQYSMDLELFEVKETSITHGDGHISISKTPKVTGKGQIYFINKFKV